MMKRNWISLAFAATSISLFALAFSDFDWVRPDTYEAALVASGLFAIAYAIERRRGG